MVHWEHVSLFEGCPGRNAKTVTHEESENRGKAPGAGFWVTLQLPVRQSTTRLPCHPYVFGHTANNASRIIDITTVFYDCVFIWWFCVFHWSLCIYGVKWNGSRRWPPAFPYSHFTSHILQCTTVYAWGALWMWPPLPHSHIAILFLKFCEAWYFSIFCIINYIPVNLHPLWVLPLHTQHF